MIAKSDLTTRLCDTAMHEKRKAYKNEKITRLFPHKRTQMTSTRTRKCIPQTNVSLAHTRT